MMLFGIDDVEEPFAGQKLIYFTGDAAQIVFVFFRELVQIGVIIQLLPKVVHGEDEVGKVFVVHKSGVFNDFEKILVTVFKVVMQGKKINVLRGQRVGVLLGKADGFFKIGTLPFFRDLHGAAQIMAVWVAHDKVAKHVEAGFVEKDALNHVGFSALFFMVCFIEHTLKYQRNQNHFDGEKRDVMKGKNGNMVKITKNEVVENVKKRRQAEQGNDKAFNGQAMPKGAF